jgi:hypothetical protein
MKAYGVAVCHMKQLVDFAISREYRAPGGVGAGWTNLVKTDNFDTPVIGPQRELFFFDTEEDAEAWAKEYSQRNAGVAVIAFKSMSMCQSVPSPAVKSVFTDKGLLPA